MRFTKAVFYLAVFWGLLTLVPLYFMFNLIGKNDPPPITHPGFFYGFVGVGLAWQSAFFVIARDPVRLRPMMIPCVIEKFSYGIAVGILVAMGRMHPQDLLFGVADTILGIFFVIAYLKTPRRNKVAG